MANVVRKQRAGTVGRLLRKPLQGRFVEILDLECHDRNLTLITARSRAVRRHDIHELMLTDEQGAAPGGTVVGVDYLGFVEFPAGGMLVHGDAVVIGGQRIGTIAGFDECHFPNHYNVVITGPRRATGVDLDQYPDDPVIFEPATRE
jgi:hypothetical protein